MGRALNPETNTSKASDGDVPTLRRTATQVAVPRACTTGTSVELIALGVASFGEDGKSVEGGGGEGQGAGVFDQDVVSHVFLACRGSYVLV